MNYYESGGVQAPRQHMQEQMNTCCECGATWFGNSRAMCGKCRDETKVDTSKGDCHAASSKQPQ